MSAYLFIGGCVDGRYCAVAMDLSEPDRPRPVWRIMEPPKIPAKPPEERSMQAPSVREFIYRRHDFRIGNHMRFIYAENSIQGVEVFDRLLAGYRFHAANNFLVHERDGSVRVDLAAYFKSPEGQAQLENIELLRKRMNDG